MAHDYQLQFCSRLRHFAAFFFFFNCQIDEFIILDDKTIEFQIKSLEFGADFKVNHKPSLYLTGTRFVEVLQNVLLCHRPLDLKDHIQLRLFLKPRPKAVQYDEVWYSNQVLGKDFAQTIVSAYVKLLQQQGHPLFLNSAKYTNTSFRKYHVNQLSKAGAPLHIMQASLAQNTRHYARGAHDSVTKKKVADIVAGKRSIWHSPDKNAKKHRDTISTTTLLEQPSIWHSPDKHAKKLADTVSTTNLLEEHPAIPSIQATSKKISISFSSATSKLDFSLDL
jgi:hypothetical protein